MTSTEHPRLRLGVDIGGTFTDLAASDPATGQISFAKVASTPGQSGFAVRRAAEKVGLRFSDVDVFLHGTTVATNTVLEQTGARVGLLTTRGFRDVLEIARSDRPEVYGLGQEKFGPGRPEHLVPRYLRLEVDERVRYTGEIERPLDQHGARTAIRELLDAGIDSLAISLLHAYANPIHEKALKALVDEERPDLPATLSSTLSPEIREYERTSTAVVNAYLVPAIASYLRHIEDTIRSRGYKRADYFVMTSSGGVIASRSARDIPIATLESGPAAGVIAATYVAAQVGMPNVISFDMGGTTAKAGLVQNGRPMMASDFKVAALQGSVLRRGPGGGGFAIKTLVTDLAEVGVGGGSIAWLDQGERIRVGPRSAGAQPGPAGYGRGGLEPTVTDADLLLGRVDPMFFAGGELRLDAAASARAFRERLGTPTGLAVADLAWGVVEIANQKMIQAIRAVSVERGYDPRDYALVAFGSAAPQHAAHIGQALEVPKVIVPSGPGCMSALGLLISELRTDFTLTVMAELSTVDLTRVNAAIERSCRDGDALISQDQSTNEKTHLAVSADLRYQGQSWELSVPVAGNPLTPASLQRLRRDFEAAHRTQYGYHLERGIVLLVAIRISVSKSQPGIAHSRLREGGRRPAEDAFKGTRDVMLERQEGFRPTPVFDRARLATGNLILGPALVEESQSTTVVPGGWRIEVDPNANLVLEPRSDGA